MRLSRSTWAKMIYRRFRWKWIQWTKTCLVCGREDVPRHISVWVNLANRSRRGQWPRTASDGSLAFVIASTSSENNWTFCRSESQTSDTVLILLMTILGVSTASRATASSIECLETAATENSMMFPVLYRLPWAAYLHSSRVITDRIFLLAKGVQHATKTDLQQLLL